MLLGEASDRGSQGLLKQHRYISPQGTRDRRVSTNKKSRSRERPRGNDGAIVLVSERHIQPGSKNQIVLLCAFRRIRHVDIAELILPSKPLADFGHGPQV